MTGMDRPILLVLQNLTRAFQMRPWASRSAEAALRGSSRRIVAKRVDPRCSKVISMRIILSSFITFIANRQQPDYKQSERASKNEKQDYGQWIETSFYLHQVTSLAESTVLLFLQQSAPRGRRVR